MFYNCFTTMATLKALILTHQKRDDGTYNVKIRLTHNRKSRYISTPFYVSQQQLTRGMKIKDQVILSKVDEQIHQIRDRITEIGFIADSLDIDKLLALIQKSRETACFTDYMANKIAEIRKDTQREGTASYYETALKDLLRYNGNKPLMFNQMTKAYITKYYKDMLGRMKVKSANAYLTALKVAYNSARKELNDEDADIIIVRYSCFDIEREKNEDSAPRAFDTVEEMQAVIDTPYKKAFRYNLVKDLFVFSFVCFGMNPCDIINLKKTDYKDGILTYRRKKIERRAGTRAEMQIKMTPVGDAIIKKYKGDKEYLFNFGSHKRGKEFIPIIHQVFKDAGIDDKYVFYSARHSMATFARNICKIDKSTVHEMLCHTKDNETAITDIYIKRDFEHLWEANDKLMSLFDWSFYLK